MAPQEKGSCKNSSVLSNYGGKGKVIFEDGNEYFGNYLGGIGDSGFVSRKNALFYDLKHKMHLQRVPNPQ